MQTRGTRPVHVDSALAKLFNCISTLSSVIWQRPRSTPPPLWPYLCLWPCPVYALSLHLLVLSHCLSLGCVLRFVHAAFALFVFRLPLRFMIIKFVSFTLCMCQLAYMLPSTPPSSFLRSILYAGIACTDFFAALFLIE